MIKRQNRSASVILAVIFSAIIAGLVFAETPASITVDISGRTAGLAYNETFTATVGITDNPGFASMVFRIDIPRGLELVGLELTDEALRYHPDVAYGFDLPSTIHTPLTGEIFTGWLGRSRNFYGNGPLFSITFRATEAAPAGQTAPVLVTFASGLPAYELPKDINANELQIELPGGVTGRGQSAVLARVTFDGVFVLVDSDSLRLFDVPQNSASITVTVGGLPANERFYFADSATPGTPGISIDWLNNLSPNVEISGYVQTDANGIGTGVLTMTVQ